MSVELVGYTDVLSVEQGGEIKFHVSSGPAEYTVELVRLIQGDEHPEGPGFQEAVVESAIAGRYSGVLQSLRPGSFVRIPSEIPLESADGLTLAAWFYPTLPGDGQQQLIALGNAVTDSRFRGLQLLIDAQGRLSAAVGDGSAADRRATIPELCVRRAWHFAAVTLDAFGELTVHLRRPDGSWAHATAGSEDSAAPRLEASTAVFAARPIADSAGSLLEHCYNGKLEGPTLLARALGADDLSFLASGSTAYDTTKIAQWDFSHDISTTSVRDVVGGFDGQVVNMPTRAVTGHAWSGSEHNWTHASHEYGAIHFHDDDLEDAAWDPSFELTVPADLPSGVYAARLRADGAEDYLPFFVRPPRGTAHAPLAVLIPTLTYLAYANEAIGPPHDVSLISPEDEYVSEMRLVSQYNFHRDGSGVAFASRRRPLLNLRPKYRYWLTNMPFGLPADLHLLSWLDSIGEPYDVITDEDLHHEGVELLRRYRVVSTGTHPEYVTGRMMEALKEYVEAGHRLMYLGGNGFYEVTALHEETPWVSEIRRNESASLWNAEPGEVHLASTGELGGHWRNRRSRARELVGVEFVYMTHQYAAYDRCEASFDPQYSWIFAGVGDHERIGEFGLVQPGAASVEIDAVDFDAGTPHDTVVLAQATDFTDEFTNPRADMTFRSLPHGGAVFATSSIGWCGSLPVNGYQNNVSTITANVLRSFLSEGHPRWQVAPIDAQPTALSSIQN